MTEVDGIKLVNEAWPLDGPYSPESLLSASQAIAELYRYLARATIDGAKTAVPNIPDAYPAFGALMTAANSAEQVMQQLAARVERFAEFDPTVRHDSNSNVEGNQAADALLDAAEYLHSAAGSAGQMGADLSRASGQLSHIYHADHTRE
jgi:methyl-accepting chemotaxis protein